MTVTTPSEGWLLDPRNRCWRAYLSIVTGRGRNLDRRDPNTVRPSLSAPAMASEAPVQVALAGWEC